MGLSRSFASRLLGTSRVFPRVPVALPPVCFARITVVPGSPGLAMPFCPWIVLLSVGCGVGLRCAPGRGLSGLWAAAICTWRSPKEGLEGYLRPLGRPTHRVLTWSVPRAARRFVGSSMTPCSELAVILGFRAVVLRPPWGCRSFLRRLSASIKAAAPSVIRRRLTLGLRGRFLSVPPLRPVGVAGVCAP